MKLRNISMFNGLSDQELAQLDHFMEEFNYPTDTVIFKQGDEGDGMYIILQGAVKLITTNAQGKSHTLNVIAEGSVFGEMSLLTGDCRSATAITTSNVKLLKLGNDFFNELLEKHSTIGAFLLRLLCTRLTEINAQIIEINNNLERTVKERTSELEEANRQLKILSQLDGLTKLPNRRYFDEMLSIELKKANENKLNLSLLLLDVDCFKQFNDTYGHKAGDECLQSVADVLNELMCNQQTLFAARYGGEEFAIILSETDEMKALEVAENVRNAIEHLQIPHEKSSASDYVTASIGLYFCVPEDSLTVSDMIIRADQGLYHAKENGRNQVGCFQ